MRIELRQFAADILLALVSLTVWVSLTAISGNQLALALPLVGVAGAVGLWVFLRAARGEPVTLLGILAVCAVVLCISFREREQGAAGLDWQNGIKVVVWLGLAAISMLNWRVILQMCADRAVLAWLCFSLICVLSAAYSPVPLFSAMSGVSTTAYMGFACLLAVAVPARTIWLVMVWAIAAYVAVNLVAGFMAPDIALLDGRLQGISGHPNSLGRQTSLLLILVVGAYYREDLGRRWLLPLLGLCGVTLLWTQSRTALLSCVIAGLCQLRRSWLLLVLAGVLLIGVIIYLSGASAALLDVIGRDGETKDALTMAGRTELWQFVLHEIGQRPLLGYGFNSFEVIATPLWYGLRAAAMETHNNYLEVLFSTGIIGFIPFTAGILILLYRWITEPYLPRDLFVLALLIASFTEVDIATIAVLPTLAFFIIITLDARRRLASQEQRDA